jgi:hypothetical protein
MRPLCTLSITSFSMLLPVACFADWKPIILNGIKWTSANQDIQTIAYTTDTEIFRLPVKYYGGIDTNIDGILDEKEITRFHEWVSQYVPQNYTGPIALDYERPWWDELKAETITQNRLDQILSVYVQGLNIATSIRPEAQWGYYGLPTLRNTQESWLNQGLSLEPLISNSRALYPYIYNCTPDKNVTKRIENHVSEVLREARGTIPVYVFISPTYCGQNKEERFSIPDEVFLRDANAAMRAKWTDENGVQHRIKGIVLWDGYKYVKVEDFNSIDLQHKRYFVLLEALTQAWKKAMKGIEVVDGPASLEDAQKGLPEPSNSGDTITAVSHRNASYRNSPEREHDRVESDRVPSNRIVE